MFDGIPESRKNLIDLYFNKENSSVEMFSNLEPEICAKIRDKECFDKAPFSPLHNIRNCNSIKIGDRSIRWVYPDNQNEYLKVVNLDGFVFKKICEKRIKFIEESLEELIKIFPIEVKFISDFTSTILWLEQEGDNNLGSAAFYDIPHCTFFSDFAMFSIPPEVIVPKQFSGYAIFENLYHEALHHQMHAFSKLATEGYLLNNEKSLPKIKLLWRDRTFTLLEAIHALHVYSLITPLRGRFLKKLTNNIKINIDNKNYEWIQAAYKDGMKMWKDIGEAIMTYSHYLRDPWSQITSMWNLNYELFNLQNNEINQ